MMTTRVALPVAAGWLTAAILFSLVSYRAFARLPLGDPRLPGIAEFRICNRHAAAAALLWISPFRSEEHTSELQSLMRISYAVFCLKKKNKHITLINKIH